MSDADDFNIPRAAVAAGVGIAGIIIFLVIVYCVRSKRNRNRSAAPPRTPQPAMRPIIIREQDFRPPPPQIRPGHPVHVPPYHPNTNISQFQTPMSETSETSHAPGVGAHPQMFDPRTIPAFHPPATPPTTYHPQPPVRYHVLHARPHPPAQQQPQQPNQFDSEDMLSFEATGEDKQAPCPICLGPLEEEPISTGQCLHLMHTSCLKGWLAKDAKSACPVCRLPYSDDLSTGRPTPTAPPLDHEDAAAGPT